MNHVTTINPQSDTSNGEKRYISAQEKQLHPTLYVSLTIIRVVTQVSYVIVSIFCFVMVVWILIFPSSIWHEHSSTHRKLLHLWFYSMSNGQPGATSSELIAKYTGQYLVQMTHILPSAIWAAIIPFQLNTKFRKHHRTLHRYMGYGFMVSGQLLGIGVFIILHKGLLYENSFTDLPPKEFSVAIPLMFLTIYFLGTMYCALYYAAIASPKNYYRHSIWMTRHVASGIWISLQRIMLGTPLFNRPPMSRYQQREAFGQAAFLAMAITTFGGEILIYLWNYERCKSETKLGYEKEL